VKELFAKRAIVPESVLVRELSGEAVLLNLDNSFYYGLDEVGFRMWSVLTSVDTVGAAYERLLSEYHVEPDVLSESMDVLIRQCVEHGLLTLLSPSSQSIQGAQS
jgi:hypothetical protein